MLSFDSRGGAPASASRRADGSVGAGGAALVFEDREYSRPELEALAGGLAATLARRGVRSGDRVALMSSNRPEFVVAVQAIWQVGAAVVLISPAWKHDEVAHALDVTSAVLGVGDVPVLAELLPTVDLDEPVTPAQGPRVPPDPAADAVLVFSSGTTGRPKAVRHTHASFAAAVVHWRDALGMTSADRIQIVTPPAHILGLLNIATALESGARMRLHRRFDIDRMLHYIEADRVTIEMAVAPIALAIASHPELEAYDLSSLRYIMWGATPVTASVAETVTRRTGVPWVPAYGASELPVIACNPLVDARLDSVGRPVPGVTVRIVSLDDGHPLGPDGVGEIQARSASVMAGYLPSEATAGAFDDGWYRTGDVGYLDPDGWLRITDRSKEMIKVRGFQVAPAEIESVLLGHPDVADCAVFGVPDPADGEAIVAAVATNGTAVAATNGTAVAATNSPAVAAELVELVGSRLASYKMPRRVEFVPEIPRLPSGKVLRRVLKEQYGRPSDE
ncbi:AMP-binding protein [Rhodococcus sp. DMU1]|uniref:class I adenylate-forming enzyme family protein n=1 Tax=Rhodococcus sp. DMU1 TaxID=2722825 RepID=UPI00143EA373|nr:AMP-binding protein [Rhodococcus sp. DMU1]QIX52701.1 acyl--CoA ligase [Rhodococcus sp. DMU1]